jgi:L-threonylcarbamoyladenylate synthase
MSQSQFVSKCTVDSLQRAANSLLEGNLVAFPTETVYGLGADALNKQSVARIYQVKGRPEDHPLIVHIHSMQVMGQWVEEVPEYAIALGRDFWPGPMTLIFKRSNLAQDFITGGQDTVGIRVPNHLVALGLLEAFHSIGGRGIAAPSANRFGNVSPTTAQAVSDELGVYLAEGDQVLDGGPCAVGVESTIIDCTGELPRILRPGAITEQMISQSTHTQVGSRFVYTDEDLPGITLNGKTLEINNIRVSGSLEKHYSPAARVILDQIPVAGQGFIAPSRRVTPTGVKRLAAPKNLDEFARDLYAALRKADEMGLAEVVVEQPIGDGLAIAIRDRLMRAAHTDST